MLNLSDVNRSRSARQIHASRKAQKNQRSRDTGGKFD